MQPVVKSQTGLVASEAGRIDPSWADGTANTPCQVDPFPNDCKCDIERDQGLHANLFCHRHMPGLASS